MYSDQSKSVSVTAGALFSIAIIGYFLTPISTPEPVSTDISIPHIGRRLMGYEEKALVRSERSPELELSAADYWLDDTLQVTLKILSNDVIMKKMQNIKYT